MPRARVGPPRLRGSVAPCLPGLFRLRAGPALCNSADTGVESVTTGSYPQNITLPQPNIGVEWAIRDRARIELPDLVPCTAGGVGYRSSDRAAQSRRDQSIMLL